jgi:acyl-CoA thioesterase-1
MRFLLGLVLLLCTLAVAGIGNYLVKAPVEVGTDVADAGQYETLVIVAMGDSLTEGLGVPETEAYPTRLEQMLRAEGHHVRVINAGISGETSSGALSRVAWTMRLEPDIVILATGANDGLRGLDTDLLAANLDQTVAYFNNHGVVVVLAGMKALQNMGPDYMKRFEQVYRRVAADQNLILMPFQLQDIALERRYTLSDGLHPNSAGYKIMAENIYPYVIEAIERVRKLSHQ